MKYMGCNTKFLREWYEFQFQFDCLLNWDNIGIYWHSDHVKPCASYDYSEKSMEKDLKECLHWTNLRPLRSRTNLLKSAKINPMVIIMQEHKINLFCKQKGITTTYSWRQE
jgi:hypothetical protein